MHTWSHSSTLLFIDSVAIAIAQGYMLVRARLVAHPSPVVRLAAARDAAVWDTALLERELPDFLYDPPRYTWSDNFNPSDYDVHGLRIAKQITKLVTLFK